MGHSSVSQEWEISFVPHGKEPPEGSEPYDIGHHSHFAIMAVRAIRNGCEDKSGIQEANLEVQGSGSTHERRSRPPEKRES